jgi:hypothetical protein
MKFQFGVIDEAEVTMVDMLRVELLTKNEIVPFALSEILQAGPVRNGVGVQTSPVPEIGLLELVGWNQVVMVNGPDCKLTRAAAVLERYGAV